MSMKKQSDTMTEEGPAHVLVYGLDQANFEGSFGNQSEWPYPLRYLPEDCTLPTLQEALAHQGLISVAVACKTLKIVYQEGTIILD